MSVYVLLKEGGVAEYQAPAGKSAWISESDYQYKIYYPNCRCCRDQIRHTAAPHTEAHNQLIAHVPKDNIVSIGFEPPNVQMPPVSFGSFDLTRLRELADWLEDAQEKGRVPKKLATRQLRLVAGGA